MTCDELLADPSTNPALRRVLNRAGGPEALDLLADGLSGADLIGDGGFVDWTRLLTGNQKERLLISGIGVERFAESVSAPQSPSCL